MQLRSYLSVVARHKWLVALGVLFGLLGAFFLSARAVPAYSATSTLLLLPNDPSERVTLAPGGYFDPTRYNADQVSIMLGDDVVRVAARRARVKPSVLSKAVTVVVADQTDTVAVTATDTSARRAAAMANALSQSYIDFKRTQDQTALQKAADELAKQIKALEVKVNELRRAGAAANVPPNQDPDLIAANAQLTGYRGQEVELLADKSLKKGQSQLVTSADTPAEPNGLSDIVKLVLGGLFGVLLGLGLAYLRENLDERIRSRSDLEQATGLPVLAEVPVDRPSAKRNDYLALRHDPLGRMAEATRSLRTNISFLAIDRSIKRLMVTSAVPGEGKTLVAANLAVAFAQAGVRTVIVSADLRRPRLETLMQIPADGDGLSDILADEVVQGSLRLPGQQSPTERLKRAVHRSLKQTGIPGLLVLPAGRTPSDPAELLSGQHMDRLLDVLEELCDLVILDTSPLLAVTDPAALAPKVGNVLLVSSASRSNRRSVQRMMTVVRPAQARLLGVVLNRARLDKTTSAPYYDDRRGPRSFGDSGAAAEGVVVEARDAPQKRADGTDASPRVPVDGGNPRPGR